MLEVVKPGLLTTVQDGGRPHAVDLGVPIGGACDPLALATANLLVGNAPTEAALEMTVAGPTLRVVEDCVVAVAGADMGGMLAPGESRPLRRGERLEFGPAVEGSGVRAYLALAGGIDVPVVLGSRSTCLVGGFGGLDGRALRAGDVVRPRDRVAVAARRWQGTEGRRGAGLRTVRVVRGPDAGRLEGAFAALLAEPWTVSGRGDRQGIRLEGRVRSTPDAIAGNLSRGVTWGTIQLPPDGQPIVLLADHQTVGGYAAPAVAISADRSVLGQLGPGDEVYFVEITIDEAQRLVREQAAELAALAAALR